MTRRLSIALVLFAALAPAPTHAQSFSRRDVPRGLVSGLEMGIEGNLEVAPGGKVKWFVTVYEIVGGRQLRPSPDTGLRVLASFHRSDPVAETVTDKAGRAAIEFAVPDDLEQAFDLVVEARSPRGVMRRFEVSVAHTARFRTELLVDRTRVAPGDPIQVWGRVLDSVTNRPSATHEVRLNASSEGYPLGGEQQLRTGPRGVFRATLRAPDRPTTVVIAAAAEHTAVRQEQVTVVEPTLPDLLVYARPAEQVVAPGTTVQVDVVVRTADGQPVPRARLTGLSIPEQRDDLEPKVPPTLTDARGHARVPWKVTATAPIQDVTGNLAAVRTGIGTGAAQVTVRATRVASVITWAVEGGALIPGVPGRILVKAYYPDGRARSGLAVRLDSGRVAAQPATTDSDGVAVFEVSVADVDAGPPAACHGPTVAAATIHAGTETLEACLPVDPDATVRVRAEPTIAAGTELAVTLFARPAVAAAPIAVTLLHQAYGTRWTPVAQQVVPAKRDKVSFALPPELVGPIWIRARPLIGAERQEVRGGSTMVWAAPGHDFAATLTPAPSGTMRLALAGGNSGGSLGFAFALPVDQGRQLVDRLGRGHNGRPGPSAGAGEWMGFLAARIPTDQSVSAVLRDGTRVTLAMPEDSVAVGLLRDPWRSRARFVRGRLGRILFAIESTVTENLPRNLQDVAVRVRGKWRFNRELLSLVAAELGPEAITGLDGSPLTIEALQALDPAISFDNVARRLTRQRLLRLLVALRHFVKNNQLDLTWARRGDPATWLTGLDGWSSDDGETYIEEEDLFDGWGHPFAIRAARGGRARFRFLEPIVGYELVSAGPDGRFGNRDDLFDPFARILPRGSIYGEAVGEEQLLARLHGVELGRATIAALMSAFEVDQTTWEVSESAAGNQSWVGPGRIADSSSALAVEAMGGAFPAAAAARPLPPSGGDLALTLSPDPHNYLVVAGAYAPDGSLAVDAEPLRAGAPLLVDARLPERMRVGETLRVPVHVVGLDRPQTIELAVEADGAIDAAVVGGGRLTLDAGQSRAVDLELRATHAGSGRVRMRVLGNGAEPLRQSTHPIRALWDGTLRAQHGGAMVAPSARLGLTPPADAKPVRARLVVAAPRDLLRDPGFATLRAEHPELLGWAYALRGEPLPESLAAELAARRTRIDAMPALESACAAVAWSSQAKENNPELHRAVARVQSVGAPDTMRERSALLVALSAAASLATGASSGDPISALVSRIREDGWHAPVTEKSRPTVMARMAAGLLLADRRDVPGRELFERARAALTAGDHRGKRLPGEEERAVDGWIGTVALAIAARQLGHDKLAEQLVREIAPRLYLGLEGGREAEFWLLAASVYGVFGIERPDRVTVKINGKEQQLALDHGVATLPLPGGKQSIEIESDRPVLARVEARYVRPVVGTGKSPLAASLDGHAGYVGDTAALEAVVKNGSKRTIARPVLEILLPSAGVLPRSALATIAAAAGVVRVDAPDAQGLLHLELAPIEPLQELRLPLPIRWIARGKVEGLSMAVFDADQPWRVSSTPAVVEELSERPEEKWQ